MQAVGGALLLINRYVPLALTILEPVIGLVRGMRNTLQAGLRVLCVLTVSPIPESTSCLSGCPRLGRTFAPPIWMAFRPSSELNTHVGKGEKGSKKIVF